MATLWLHYEIIYKIILELSTDYKFHKYYIQSGLTKFIYYPNFFINVVAFFFLSLYEKITKKKTNKAYLNMIQ